MRKLAFGSFRRCGAGAIHSVVLLLCALACQQQEEEQALSVDVGVFYGGQVQKLALVDVDRASPPKIGFRIVVHKPRREPELVTYEVVALGPAGRRVKRTDSITLAPGREYVDQVIPIEVDARLGIWNIRVLTQSRILADRALYLREAGGS